jgi:hypothetical protein
LSPIGRINIAACSLGAAQMSLDLAIEHTKMREAFGKTLSQFQWTQFKLAEMAVKVSSYSHHTIIFAVNVDSICLSYSVGYLSPVAARSLSSHPGEYRTFLGDECNGQNVHHG